MNREEPPRGRLLRFERPAGQGAETFCSLGLSHRAAREGSAIRQLTGHWCSRCAGIWFGFPLEVECPACGNRNG